jgi:type I restriction enzyme M protein
MNSDGAHDGAAGGEGDASSPARASHAAPANNHSGLIWSIADLLRGDYKQSEYGRVILPLVVLRRLDCVLEPTKQQILDRLRGLGGRIENIAPILERITGLPDVYNTSRLTLKGILADPAQVAGNLRAWIAAFDADTRDVIEKFDFDAQIGRLDRAKLLYLVLSKVTEVDLHPHNVSNVEMGYLYEELIRRFSELSNETAGEHFTPREVIRLMVDLLFIEDDRALRTPGIVRTMLDPACGTGGMLSVASEYLRDLNPGARLEGYGQELNAETYAICRSDMMLKGQKASNIRLGDSFSDDAFRGARYDYLLANPPFGVKWEKSQRAIEDERLKLGFGGRFGAGLPRINDGSFLFLQHMISKLKRPEEGGGRLAIVFNGSPLFTGGAGSGESEIRRWIIENDWLEGIVALPDQLFYNTGISTYVWVVTNRKKPQRRGTVQLVDARELFTKMRKSLGNKRNEVGPDQIEEIARLYGTLEENEQVKILPNDSLGFQRITVERPLRLRYGVTRATLPMVETSTAWPKLTEPERLDLVGRLETLKGLSSTDRAEVARRLGPLPKAINKAVWDALAVRDPDAPIMTGRKGHLEPDPELRDNENVPLVEPVREYDDDPTARLASPPYKVAVDAYMETEVLPFVPDAWVDHTRTKIGYEIPLTRHFYRYVPPRALEEIDAEIKALEDEIQRLLHEVTA